MQAVAISDTHNQLDKIAIPDCDLLIIAGDIIGHGRKYEIEKFNDDLVLLKRHAKKVMLIPGNHDHLSQDDPAGFCALIPNVDYYLAESSMDINGIKFYGSPWTPTFGYGWAWNADRGAKIKSKWDQIPSDTQVLITHGPPRGMLDDADIFNTRLGCSDLLNVVLKIRPRFHIFGHIHGGHGMKDSNGTTFINASTCNERYQPINKPIVFTI